MVCPICEDFKGKICGHCGNSPNCPKCGFYNGKTVEHDCEVILNAD